MIKIAVFSERLWPEGSGAQLATNLILKLLASHREFKVKIFTGSKNPSYIPGAEVLYVDFLRAYNKLELFLKMYKNRSFIEKLIKKSDVIYVPRFSYPTIPIADKLGKKILVHLHDYQPISYTAVILYKEDSFDDLKRTFILEYKDNNLAKAFASTIASLTTKIIRKWVGLANKIICVSKRQEDIILKFAPEYKGKTAVIHNLPPNVSFVDKNLNMLPTFLYSGGSSYAKGFYSFLSASQEVLKKNHNIRFYLTNKYGKKQVKMLENIKKLYSNAYTFYGRLSYTELLKLHERVWGLVFPSVYEEPLPYAVLESMLLGTIPVASRVGGVPQIIEGSGAERFLFSPLDVNEFVEKMEILALMDSNELKELGFKISTQVRHKFDVEKIANQVIESFVSVI
jgi:glycosyltransferase involved in cell wall biosynthesis